jgi:hypothetical protein
MGTPKFNVSVFRLDAEADYSDLAKNAVSHWIGSFFTVVLAFLGSRYCRK